MRVPQTAKPTNSSTQPSMSPSLCLFVSRHDGHSRTLQFAVPPFFCFYHGPPKGNALPSPPAGLENGHPFSTKTPWATVSTRLQYSRESLSGMAMYYTPARGSVGSKASPLLSIWNLGMAGWDYGSDRWPAVCCLFSLLCLLSCSEIRSG